jgi:hypothetical protein
MRLVVLAVTVAVGAHLLLWDLPWLAFGETLTPYFDWLLATTILIPMALASAIGRQGLFGIEGILMRDIKKREAELKRALERIQNLEQRIQKTRVDRCTRRRNRRNSARENHASREPGMEAQGIAEQLTNTRRWL